ncbi:hypothetical protein [Arthrobacter sp. A5]|uniref:hypothetical protein n=1 Tax=Arthrobacter sp. A5 TaxID=576926 RepID=UPI003DA9F03A
MSTTLNVTAGIWTLAAPESTAAFIAPHLWTSVRGAVPFRSAVAQIGHDGDLITATADLDVSALATGNARRDRDLAKPICWIPVTTPS